MKLECEILTDDFSKKDPAYRVFLNTELMSERDYVIPQGEMGHYNFICHLDLPAGENKLEVQGVDHQFYLGTMWLDDNQIAHNGGVFQV